LRRLKSQQEKGRLWGKRRYAVWEPLSLKENSKKHNAPKAKAKKNDCEERLKKETNERGREGEFSGKSTERKTLLLNWQLQSNLTDHHTKATPIEMP